MAESILVTGKKISSMELVTNVTGKEKIPTGQPDDLAVTPNQIADHTIARGDLVSQEDLSQVEVSLGTQITDLENDVASADNSIRGLIAAEEAARIAADNLKVDKEGSVSSVAGRVGDVVLAPSDVLVEGFGSQEDVNKYVPKPFLSGYTYGLGERVILTSGKVVKSTVEGNVGNPNVSMAGWVSEVSDSLATTVQTFTTPEAGVDQVTGVANGAYFNVRSEDDDTVAIEYKNIDGSAVTTGKIYPSGSYVENIAEHTALPFKQGKGYALHERVHLDDGDIVKSVIDGNTNDPNVSMTGWVKVNSASQIFDESGRTQQEINDIVKVRLTPEQFYLPSDGNDWLASFQRMSNKALELGGAKVALTKKQYTLSSFTPQQVPKSLWRNNVANSKIWYIAPNTVITSDCGGTTLNIEGGSSAPFGWSTSANVLVVGNEEDSYAVLSVNQPLNSVTLADASMFSVGMVTQLYRLGGNTADGVPITPSRERAPCQILTVKTVVGNVVTFEESFVHDFYTRSDLYLSKQKNNIGEYPADVFLDGVEFKSINDTKVYILFSRQKNGGFGKLKLNGASGSYGMSQGFVGSTFEIIDKDFTIESVSNWHIGNYRAIDNTGLSKYGLLLNDNSRAWRIDKFYAENYKDQAMQVLFGVSGSFGQVDIINCGLGTPTVSSQANTAMVIGTIIDGFYPTKAVAYSPAFLRKNLGMNSISIGNLSIKGFNKRPILVCNSDLIINSAYIEYDESTSMPVIQLGDSGKSLNDETYYTDNSKSSIVINKLDIITKNKTQLNVGNIVNQSFGVAGLLYNKPMKLTSDAISTDTVINVDDASCLYHSSSPIYFEGSGVTARVRSISSISGNAVTLTSPVGVDLSAGTLLWTTPIANAAATLVGARVEIKNITVDGVPYPNIKMLPYRFEVVGATTNLLIPIRQLGVNRVSISITNFAADNGIPYTIDILANSLNSGSSAVIEKQGGNTAFGLTATSVSMIDKNTAQLTITRSTTASARMLVTFDYK